MSTRSAKIVQYQSNEQLSMHKHLWQEDTVGCPTQRLDYAQFAIDKLMATSLSRGTESWASRSMHKKVKICS